MNNLTRIIKEDYQPTLEDVINCRRKTIGIFDFGYEFNGVKYQLYDTGGQRSERKKIIKTQKFLQKHDFILFFTSYIEFAEFLYEDESQISIFESIVYFEQVLKFEEFAKVPLILVFTKKDLFSSKKHLFSKTFPEYKGSDEEEMMTFIKNTFLAKIKDGRKVKVLEGSVKDDEFVKEMEKSYLDF